jgi:hypothetical protein
MPDVALDAPEAIIKDPLAAAVVALLVTATVPPASAACPPWASDEPAITVTLPPVTAVASPAFRITRRDATVTAPEPKLLLAIPDSTRTVPLDSPLDVAAAMALPWALTAPPDVAADAPARIETAAPSRPLPLLATT